VHAADAPGIAGDDEVGDVTSTPGRRWWAFVLAAVAAVLGALVAPSSWPSGPGELAVLHGDEVVASFEVPVGDAAALHLTLDAPGARGTLSLPDGIPVDQQVTVQIDLADGSDGVDRAALSLRLALPDGDQELIPVVRTDADTGVIEAARRPPVNAGAILALLGAVVVLWVTEAAPLWVTSLAIPVYLVVTGVGEPTESLASFFHPIIALFFAGFLMAEAMRRSGLDRLVAISIIARAGRSPVTLYAAVLGIGAFMGLWMSNTAAAALLIPIALAITAPMESIGYRRAMVLSIAYVCTLSGVGSAIGTPANPLAIAYLDDFVGRQVAFVEWFVIGLPFVIIFLPILGTYLWWRMGAKPDGERFGEARRVAREELAAMGRPTRDQLVVLAVFVAVIAVWLTETWHGIATGIVALGGAIALALLGRIETRDLGRISWASLLTFGGGLTLGLFLLESGTSDWIATQLGGLAAVPAPLAVAAIAAVTLALTTVASNTATAAMLIPLAIPLSAIIGVDPVLLVLVVAIASSIDFALVIGTPPTLLAYSTGLFTPGRIFRVGIVLDIIGLLLLVTVMTWLWQVFGVV